MGADEEVLAFGDSVASIIGVDKAVFFARIVIPAGMFVNGDERRILGCLRTCAHTSLQTCVQK